MVNMNSITLDNFLKSSLDELNVIYSAACCGLRSLLPMANFANTFYEIYFLPIKSLAFIYMSFILFQHEMKLQYFAKMFIT